MSSCENPRYIQMLNPVWSSVPHSSKKISSCIGRCLEKNTIKGSIRCVLSIEQQTGLTLFWLEKRQPEGDTEKIQSVMNRDWLLLSFHMKIMGHHMRLQRTRFKGKCSSLTVQLTCPILCCRSCCGCWKFTEVQNGTSGTNEWEKAPSMAVK